MTIPTARERGAVSRCEPSLVYFQSGDVNAAPLVTGTPARDWLTLVAVAAFVDKAREGEGAL